MPCEKWTTSSEAAERFGINWIAEEWGEGLCEKPDTIYHGHGSGYSLIGMAHKKGAQRVLLLGYDLKYPEGYDGHQRVTGGKRHFFGEYHSDLQHWPKNPWVDLLPLYRAIHEQGAIEIINCTPGSALEGVIPSKDIHAV